MATKIRIGTILELRQLGCPRKILNGWVGGKMIQGRISKVALMTLMAFSVAAYAAKKIEFVPGEYVVKLKDSAMASKSLLQLEKALDVKVVEKLSPQSKSILVKRSEVEMMNSAIAILENNPLVEYAEPNFIYRVVGGATGLPNDPQLSQLWGLKNDGQTVTGDLGPKAGRAGIDIDAARAWQVETGSRQVVVASIDTGVDHAIEDLAPNMWVNEAEKNGAAGADDDNNGFVDDIYGYNFVTNQGDPKDDHGHGSHTSGTIGAKGDNGIGIVGVAWNVRIMGVKFLSASGGGTLADAVKSIDYTTQMKVDMTSNSWGGGGYSQALYDSIKRAGDAGILFVAAAGNSASNNDDAPEYPASYDLDNIISVAAIDNAGQMAYFSCYGKSTVDVAAPGVNIYSTIPGGFDSWSGTSMATPHVTGVAALLKSKNPSMTYADIKARIINTARPLGTLRGKVLSGGMVNAYHALLNTAPPPDANDPFNWDKSTYNISTPHPYSEKYSNTWTVNVPGAKKVAVYFSKFETETGYDKVVFKDANGNIVGTMSGSLGEGFSPVAEGDTLIITFTSDESANGYGFDVEAVAYK